MQAILTAGLLNAFAATGVAVGAVAVAAIWRNPFVNRGLWLAVLLKFAIPPLVLLPLIEWPSSQEPSAAPVVDLAAQPKPLRVTSTPAPAASENASSPDAHVLPYWTFPPDSTVPPFSLPDELVGLPLVPSNAPSSPVALPEAAPIHFPRPRVAPRSSWDLPLDLAAILWLGGALAFLCVALMRLVTFHRALSRAPVASDAIQRRAGELAAQAGMPATPIVRITAGRTPPLVWRMAYGATILLPAELVDRLSAPELDAILAHELTHLRRGDDRYRWLEFAVVTAFWWCPSAWFARRQLHEAEERCCDADALSTFPALARHYASALLAAIDCLAPAPRYVVGTPLFNRGSTVRRFESITASRRPSRPSRAMGWLLAAAGVAILVVTPVAASADGDAEVEAPALPSMIAPASPSRTDLTIAAEPGISWESGVAPNVAVDVGETLLVKMPDGKTREGRIVFERGVPVLLWDANESTGDRSSSLFDGTVKEMWDRSLRECVSAVIEHNRFGMIPSPTGGVGVLEFVPRSGSKMTIDDAHVGLTNQIRDVQDAYWELWYAYRNLDAAKHSRDLAIETWKRVKSLQRVGSVGGEDNSEAESRAHYYLLRGRVNTAMKDLFRVENRLRYLLGLPAEDGRLIRPIDEPTTQGLVLDVEGLRVQAKSNRAELTAVQAALAQAKIVLRDAERALNAAITSDSQRPELEASRRSAQTAVDELKRQADDRELEILHQLHDAIRDVELEHSLVETNRKRSDAARDEVAAVGRRYEAGQITLDRVLLAQIRQADAESAYAHSLADHSRAILRLRYRTGATITKAGYRIKQAAAGSGAPTAHVRYRY